MTGLNKLMLGERVNVVFMGGSITAGAHSSEYKKCWAARVEEHLKAKFGPALFFHNAGVGGTGSGLGIFRLERDVLKYDPDILFLEFAVNDEEDSRKNPQKVIACMEGIVRRLVTHNPSISIIFIFTTTRDHTACTELHKKVADYYGIPWIDLQEKVIRDISDGLYTWEDIADDFWHPVDKGHGIYAEYICNCMDQDPMKFFAQNIRLKDSLGGREFGKPVLVDADRAIFSSDWQSQELKVPGKLESIRCCDQTNAYLQLEFTGRCFGIYNQIASDAGILKCVIDDAIEFEIDMYYDIEPYCASSLQRIDLEPGRHTAKLWISESSNPKSTGRMIRLGYFLLDEENKSGAWTKA